MRRLTDAEYRVLHEVGDPEEFVPNSAFETAIENGWGRWIADGDDCVWRVTEAGDRARRIEAALRALE